MKRKVYPGSIFLIVFLIGSFINTTSAQVIKWSTYLNTTGPDVSQGMVKDNNGDIYVLGLTDANGFPVTPGAAQTGLIPYSFKATITKMSGATGNLLWSTYLGGDGDYIVIKEFVWDAVSNTVTFAASSSSGTYPVAGGNSQVSGSLASAVLTQLNAATGSIIYSTHAFSDKLPIYGAASSVTNPSILSYSAVFKVCYTKWLYVLYKFRQHTQKNIIVKDQFSYTSNSVSKIYHS